MTGLVARGVGSIRVIRTTIELSVLAVGWMLGGVLGVGTVLYALAIGPLLHVLLPRLALRPSTSAQPLVATTGSDGPFSEPEGR